MTRNNYLMTGLMLAGAVWAARRYGLLNQMRHAVAEPSRTGLTDADRHTLRGETIYRNSPAASETSPLA